LGHPLGYIASEYLRAYRKAQRFNVLHPQGMILSGAPKQSNTRLQTGQASCGNYGIGILRPIEGN